MLVTSHALRAARTLAEYAALSDNDLVGAMTQRDQMALRVLMVRHQLRIGRFLRRFIADRDLAEDLVADTFFAAWQQAPRFEHRSAVATWLLAIARYKALSARSRRVLPTTPLDDGVAATLVDSGLRADAALERADRARILRQCLARHHDVGLLDAVELRGVLRDRLDPTVAHVVTDRPHHMQRGLDVEVGTRHQGAVVPGDSVTAASTEVDPANHGPKSRCAQAGAWTRAQGRDAAPGRSARPAQSPAVGGASSTRVTSAS